jgi:hypothetical protein
MVEMNDLLIGFCNMEISVGDIDHQLGAKSTRKSLRTIRFYGYSSTPGDKE